MQIPKEKFQDLLRSGEYILLDVRTFHEQETHGVISQEQIHIDIMETDASEKIKNLDHQKKYLIYCWHGRRSATTREYMQAHGFKNVYDLQGGIDAWKEL